MISLPKCQAQKSLCSQSGGAKNFGTEIDPVVCVAHAVASECLLAPFDFSIVLQCCSSVLQVCQVLCLLVVYCVLSVQEVLIDGVLNSVCFDAITFRVFW